MQAYRIISTTRHAWDICAGTSAIDTASESTGLEGMGLEARAGLGCERNRTLAGHIHRFEKSHDWPGRGYGIRGPVFGETPLSESEVLFAIDEELV